MKVHAPLLATLMLIQRPGFAQEPPAEEAPAEEAPAEEAPAEKAPPKEPAAEDDPSEEDDEPTGSRDSSTDDSSPQPQIAMPRVLEENPVEYPKGAEGSGTVILLVTVASDGSVQDVAVDQGINPALDQAATRSVRGWKFAPATKDGAPMAARIRVALAIEEPAPMNPAVSEELKAAPQAQEGSPSEDAAPAHDHEDPKDSHLGVTVHGERALRSQRRGSGDYFVHREVLQAAPHADGADALQVTPGLTLFRTEGMAQAHSYSLRGFDAEHGQDIEFVVGGLPLNLPSHIHGQGYSDLNFLISEVVDELAVNEGVSDPQQGDFAVAGTIRVGLGIDEGHRGMQVRGGYGAFNTPRVHVVWAPKEAERESFGAAQYTATDGFGEHRAAKSASGIVQHRFGSGKVTYRGVGFVHGARGESAGVLRQDDIDSGEVCYHCVYDTPTARGQNALNQRVMAGIFADYRGPDHANGSIGFYLGRDHYRSQNNFTGFLESSRTLAGVSGRGDLIAQTNDTTTWGMTGRYRTEAFEAKELGHGTLEVGLDGRFDQVEQTQNLLDATVRNQIWDQRVDARIEGLTAGIWGDVDWQFGKYVLARVGLRGAVLSYDVDDRLGNFAPLTRPQDQFLPGYRRSSMGATLGPRSSVQVRVTKWLRLLGSYGEGYRSPQARTLSEGENAPFSKVRSGDAGVRMAFGDILDGTLSGYYTHLSDDVAFEASEGRLESIGATRRMGGVATGTFHPLEWALANLSVTYVNTALLESPPATAEEPEPPFKKGQPLPFVSPLVVRLDSTIKRNLIKMQDGRPLVGRLGLGFTYLAPRPLPFNRLGQPLRLLDASAGLVWGPLDFNLSGFNLLNLDYAAREYVFVSDWDQSSPGSRVPERHIAAGAPLNVMATLGITL